MKAFEPKYSTFRADYRENLASSQQMVNVKIQLSEKAEALSVLSACANAEIGGGEALSGEATYNGSVYVKAVYCSEKGAESASVQSEFTGKITGKKLTASLKPMFSAKVLSCEIASFDRREIQVKCMIEVSLACVMENEIRYLERAGGCAEMMEGTLCAAGIVGTGSAKFTATGGTDVKDLLQGVLNSTATGLVKTTSSGLDCAVVGGDIYVNVCYKTDAENCNVKSVCFEVPFKEELVVNGATVGESVDAAISVKSVRVVAEVDEESARSHIMAEIEYEICAVVQSEMRIDVTEDVFSCECDLKTVRKKFPMTFFEGNLCFTDRVTTGFEIEDGNEIDKVLGVCCNLVNVASCYFADEKITVEGIVTSTVVCCHENKLKSFNIESPFLISQNADSLPENAMLSANVAVCDCSAKHKRTQQIDLQIELEAVVSISRRAEGEVVCEVSCAGEKPAPECAIEVLVAGGGETLWEMAKCAGVAPQEVKNQNPELEYPLTFGDKVIVYH